jgi:uncharacterized protein (TIGR00369 family)
MDANRQFLDDHGFLGHLGVAIDHQEEGAVRLSLPHDAALANPGSDALQGGVVATLIDHAGGAAVRTTLAEPLSTPHATTDLNVTYLRPATGDLTAEASVLRVGGSTATVRVDVTRPADGDGTGGRDGDVADGGSGATDAGELVAVGRVSLHVDRE